MDIDEKPERTEIISKKDKKKEKAGASLRARKSVNYSVENLGQEEEEDKANSVEYEEEQSMYFGCLQSIYFCIDAAIASGLTPYKMTPLEMREMPEYVGQGNYFEIRNHILARWHSRVNQYLSKTTAAERIQAPVSHY